VCMWVCGSFSNVGGELFGLDDCGWGLGGSGDEEGDARRVYEVNRNRDCLPPN